MNAPDGGVTPRPAPFAVARHWPGVASNAVDPGWGLAVSDDSAARASGSYWYHRKRQKPAADALDPELQDRLVATLAELTGVSLF